MNLKQIDTLLEHLEPLRKLNRFEALFDDVLKQYRPLIEKKLGDAYLDLWDASIIARMRGQQDAKNKDLVEKAIAYMPKGGEMPKIMFGQLRITTSFQSSVTTNQQDIVGFPKDKVVGRPLVVVAGEMAQSGIGDDEIPIQIFYHDKNWIAANNRGFATHCLAKKKPMRLWPRPPDQMELNRLAEVEGKGNAQTFAYAGSCSDRLKIKPHALPSLQIPLTDGPQSWVVSVIATVP